jgi:hypothetical protein
MDKYKKLLPPELKYPLSDEVLDNLLDKWALGIRLGRSNAMEKCTLAALIELKERRADNDRSRG